MGFIGFTPPYLEVRKVATVTNVYGDFATGSDMYIYPSVSGSASECYIRLRGSTGMYFFAPSAAPIRFIDGGGEMLMLRDDGTDVALTAGVGNENISLIPAGTGVVKFGTYTAGAATDSTGYITIKDAAGNTRKLMVQA